MQIVQCLTRFSRRCKLKSCKTYLCWCMYWTYHAARLNVQVNGLFHWKRNLANLVKNEKLTLQNKINQTNSTVSPFPLLGSLSKIWQIRFTTVTKSSAWFQQTSSTVHGVWTISTKHCLSKLPEAATIDFWLFSDLMNVKSLVKSSI